MLPIDMSYQKRGKDEERMERGRGEGGGEKEKEGGFFRERKDVGCLHGEKERPW